MVTLACLIAGRLRVSHTGLHFLNFDRFVLSSDQQKQTVTRVFHDDDEVPIQDDLFVCPYRGGIGKCCCWCSSERHGGSIQSQRQRAEYQCGEPKALDDQIDQHGVWPTIRSYFRFESQ